MSDRPISVADVVEAVHKGRIGHKEAMRRLHLSSFPELVDTVHMHGLSMWSHRSGRLSPATLAVLRQASGLSPARPRDGKTVDGTGGSALPSTATGGKMRIR